MKPDNTKSAEMTGAEVMVGCVALIVRETLKAFVWAAVFAFMYWLFIGHAVAK